MFFLTNEISSKSKPSLVPSLSIEFRSTSPAPLSTACLVQANASSPALFDPPCVVTSNPETANFSLVLRASIEITKT